MEQSTEDRNILLSHYFIPLVPHKVFCKFCANGTGLDYTDHMKIHLKTKHPEQYSLYEAHVEATKLDLQNDAEINESNAVGPSGDLVRLKVANIDKSCSGDEFEPPKKINKSRCFVIKIPNFSSKNIDESFINTLIGSYLPLSVMTHQNFSNFGKALNPTYRIPKKELIVSKIPMMYVECLEKYKKLLKNEATQVSLSAERWTSTSSEQYLIITAHYINKALQPVSVLLKNLHLGEIRAELPMGEIIKLQIEKTLMYWNLLDKVQTFTIEKHSNLRTAMSVHDCDWENFSCYISELNDVFNESIKLFEEITTKVKVTVDHFLRSYEATELINEHQVQIEFKTEVKQLSTCDITRWESIYGMLQIFSELENAVKANIPCLEAKLPDMTEEDWVAIRELCNALKPFIGVVQSLSSNGYLSGSMPIVLTNDLLFVFEQVKTEKYCTIVAGVIDMLRQSILSVFTDLETTNSLAICTFLDPRFKQCSFRDKWVGEITRRILLDWMTIGGEKDESDRENAAVSEDIQLRAANELEMYVNEPVIDRLDCPHTWWWNHREDYPNLVKIYVKRCHVVASSVPCKILLTEEGRKLVDRRSLIPHREVEQRVFLNANYSP